MQELILYIRPQFRNNVTQDYVKVDMFSDENVTLTQVIQDVRDIDKVFTDFSQTFSLPASKINNKLFQHWYNPDIDGFDSNIQSEAIIELNYQPFKSGKIQLQEVKMKNNKPSVYKVTFFGKTVSLNNTFGEDQLDDLAWLNNFTFANSTTNVRNGLNLGLDFTVDSVSYTDAIIHPLISRKQRYIYDSENITILSGTATSSASNKLKDTSENFTNVVLVNDVVKNTTDSTIASVTAIDDNNTLTLSSDIMSTGENYTILRGDNGNIFMAASSDPTYNRRGVFPEDLKPAIKASLIIKAIEEQYGITFKSSEFFDSTEFSNLYLWLNRKIGKYSFVFDITGNTTFNCVDVTTGSCTYFGATSQALFNNGKYTIEKTPDLTTFQYITKVIPTATYTSTNYTVEIIDALTDTIEATLTTSGTNNVGVVFDLSTDPMAIGEKKELVTRVTCDSNFVFTSEIETFVLDNAASFLYSAKHTSTSTIAATAQEFAPTQEIPEIKVLDFLKGIFKQFNLTAFLNDSDEIVVKTLDDFYGDSTTTHDISQYVKTDENTVSEALPFSDIILEYPEPKTKLALAYSNIHNNRYGKLDYQANASRGATYKVETPFGHMLYERLQDLDDDSYTSVQYGLSVNESDDEVIPKPLLFYGVYQTSISTPINFVDTVRKDDGTLADAGTRYSLTDYWMPHNANELGTASTAPAFNLNFGSEINSYTLTDYGGDNNSLFQKFYENYIVRVFNTKTRIFKYKAILPLKFLLTYSLADKVFVNGRAFTINKITTKLQTGESSLELLNEPTS
jgi:hypothetical protein